MYFWDMDNPAAYNNRMGRYKTRREREFIESIVPAEPRRILDIGGGSGRFAIPLHDAGHRLSVVDMNADAIGFLKQQRPEIDARVGDFTQIEFGPTAPFDIALCVEVLLYVRDWPAFFARVHSLLAEGGVFIFTATNRWSWRSVLQRLKVNLSGGKDYDYSIYSIGEYRNIIEGAQFRIDRVDGFVWCPCRLDSNNLLVDVCAAAEKTLRLNRFISQSPWLLYAVRKNSAV